MSDAERRHDYPELGERVARIEEAVARIDRCVDEFGPRWLRHETILTTIGADLSHVASGLGRIDRMQESVEAGFRVIEDKMQANRSHAAAEHAALKAEIDQEIRPLKALVYDRHAVDEAIEQRHSQHRPWFIAILSAVVTAALTIAGWIVAQLHGAPRP